MIKTVVTTALSVALCWTVGAFALPGDDWWLVSEGDRETLLFRPASLKRDGETVSISVRIDNRPRVSYHGRQAVQVIFDAQGKPYTGTEHDWVIDCRDRSFITRRSTQICTDGSRIETHSKGMPKDIRVEAPPKGSDVGIFFDAACRNMLVGVDIDPPPEGMRLFRMSPVEILAFNPNGIRRQGARAEAIVRIVHRKPTALSDGQRVAVTDAIWAMDCKGMQGALVAEKKLGPDGKVVGEIPKRTPAELSYTAPISGGLPEAFQRAVCDGRIAAR